MATTASPANKVWLITGCSSGFGREIAIAARARGDKVITTARKVETLDALKTLGCDALSLDITADDTAVAQVIAAAHALHGRIDVLVNNAGAMAVGAIEEASDKDVFAMFNTNVFGLIKVTRAVLPFMRAQKSGTIANVGSIAGYLALPSWGIYSATKLAVAGISQTLRVEVAPFGITVTDIEPGIFTTSLKGNTGRFEFAVNDYKPVFESALAARMSQRRKPGDPTKGAQLIVEALTGTGRAAGRDLPIRLPLGADAFPVISGAHALGQKELEAWKDFTDPELF